MIAEAALWPGFVTRITAPWVLPLRRRTARFTGLPEHVVNFFYFVAEEVRSLLATGLSSLSEVIGRADLLKVRGG